MLWQVLIALRYFATGSNYIVIGDTFGVSKSSVCRCINQVANCFATKSRQFIRIPNANTLLEIKRAFFSLGGIPNVTGAVDGCLIKVMRPKDNTSEFICQNGYAAINIQVSSGPDNLIHNTVVKWPGAVNDARIFAVQD